MRMAADHIGQSTQGPSYCPSLYFMELKRRMRLINKRFCLRGFLF